uniref:(northern house mosquito) hypothetical protein n=1 Tax=Culex pipiens TaxID=7175 RepID=A0A8D8F2K4_CULPI
MHAVKWSTTIQSAAARQVSPVIRLSGASRRKSNGTHQSQSIRACRRRADRTHSVELWERKQLVPARPTTSDVHQTAGRSAPTMRNVQATVPARTSVALIRALERVEVTPFVRLSTIGPFARAATASRVIRWCSAIARYHQQRNVLRRVHRHHAARTRNAENETMPECATACPTTKEIRTTCSPAVDGNATSTVIAPRNWLALTSSALIPVQVCADRKHCATSSTTCQPAYVRRE